MVYIIVIINLLILLGTSICVFKWKDYMWKIVCLSMLIIYVGNLFYWTISLSEFHIKLPFDNQWSINDLKIEGLANFIADTWFDLVSFIPIGVLLSFFFHYSYPTSKRIRQALFFCLQICVVFATFRYLCSYGIFDSVKIELNIFGGIIGIVIHYMFLSKINIHPLSNRVEDKKVRQKGTLYADFAGCDSKAEAKDYMILPTSDNESPINKYRLDEYLRKCNIKGYLKSSDPIGEFGILTASRRRILEYIKETNLEWMISITAMLTM